MGQDLSDYRKKIDALDNTIHDALMERAKLVDEIAAIKREEELPFIQPAREAQSIKRIIERHSGSMPEAAVVRIWRELISASSMLQTQLKVFVALEDDDFTVWDLAKSYFGSVVPMQPLSASKVALSYARDDEYTFAVVPWPKDEDARPWWVSLFDQDTNIHVVGALPFGGYKNDFNDNRFRGLVVSRVPFTESGDDNSFLVLKVDQNVSRGRIVDVFKTIGLDAVGIVTSKSQHDPKAHMHLIEVANFVAIDDERVIDVAQAFEEFDAQCRAIGGYPVSPIFKDNKDIRPEAPILYAPPANKENSA
ncbi:MAG: chorismate mutase [Pseudomonadota bacterium]